MQELNKELQQEQEQEQEEEEEEEGEEEDDEEVERTIGQDDLFVTDYEKARLERIQENSAKLAALNLPSLASSIKQAKEKPKHEEEKKQRRRRRTGVSLPCSSRAMPERQCKSSRKEDNEEEEEGEEEEEREYGDCSSDYQPSDVDGYSSSDEEEREKEEEEEEGDKRERAYQVAHGADEDDLELQQALALSLGESIEDILPKNKDNMETNEMESLGNKKGDKKHVQRADDSKRKARNWASSGPDLVVDQRKKKKRNWREMQQFTEDEINNLFILFDGNKRGRFSIHELEEIALSHDFTWNKKELADMIDIFDYDKDGKINLEEFRGVIVRCNMVKP